MSMSAEELAAVFERGREEWPQLALASADFEAYARARGAVSDELFLACACARGVPGAIDALERWCGAELAGVLRKAKATSRDELLQLVRAELFVAPPGQPMPIEDYRGEGSLRGWVRVVAVRELIRAERKSAREHPAEQQALEAMVQAGGDGELRLIQQRYRADFDAALRESAAELSTRERNLLRHVYLDQLGVDQLGALYRVHRATAARWAAGARQRLMDGTRRRLGERLGVSREDLNSLIRAVRSQLQVSLASLLAEPQGQ
jgi:RNA polymerase sigma-70 factor (ECF subfamily)